MANPEDLCGMDFSRNLTRWLVGKEKKFTSDLRASFLWFVSWTNKEMNKRWQEEKQNETVI